MGASHGRQLPETECFKRRVLLVNPPACVCKRHDVAFENCNWLIKRSRVLRSVAIEIVLWRGDSVLPDEWQVVLGHHCIVAYCLDDRVSLESATQWHQDVCSGSPDAQGILLSCSSLVSPAFKFLTDKTSASFDILKKSDEERFLFNMECVIAQNIMPTELSGPLFTLVHELVQNCGADEAHLIEPTTFLPLLSSCDDGTIVNDTPAFSICRLLNKFFKNHTMNDIGHFSVFPQTLRIIYVGWACRPHAIVVIVQRKGSAAISPALVERNLEAIGVHLFNVVNHTSAKSRHTPL